MVGPESSHGVSRVVHHKDFYLRGGDMTVLVENHLYRIHSYFFARESLFFRQKLNNLGGGEEAHGMTDHNAYTLEDVKSEDFARFLWVFYNPTYSVYDAPLDTWLSILKLANRWTFDNIKELAVRELEKIDIEPVEKIAIYHDNNISRLYLLPAYVAVCKRDKPMSFTEGMQLGMETVLRVAEARERMRQQASESGIRSPTFDDFEDVEVETLIRGIFGLGPRLGSPSTITSPTGGANGSVNGVPKLGTPPASNPLKHNGTAATRASGGSAADPRGSWVDSMPPIASVFPPQAPATATATTATPATITPATGVATSVAEAPPMATQTMAPQNPQAPETPDKTAQVAPTLSIPPPPPTPDKGDHKPQATSFSFMSPKSGVGELLSSVESAAGSRDVLNSEPVVSPSEDSNDVTAKPNDNVNDTEKNKPSKDVEVASVNSDADGGRTKQGGKNGRGARRGGFGRGQGGK